MSHEESNSDHGPVVVIETIDGRAYVGADITEALERMRASAWACADDKTLKAYMKGAAERVLRWNKSPVRCDNVDTFIADMQAAGVLIVRSMQ